MLRYFSKYLYAPVHSHCYKKPRTDESVSANTLFFCVSGVIHPNAGAAAALFLQTAARALHQRHPRYIHTHRHFRLLGEKYTETQRIQHCTSMILSDSKCKKKKKKGSILMQQNWEILDVLHSLSKPVAYINHNTTQSLTVRSDI